MKLFAAPTAALEAKVVERGAIVLEDGGAVAQFCERLVVVAGAYDHLGSVGHLRQRDHLERLRQLLVAPLVVGQCGAAEKGISRLYDVLFPRTV